MENQNAGNTTETTEGAEVLVVASKIRNYIRGKSSMNTSSAVMEALSERIRHLCDEAIERAKRDGRKTVMDRDFTA
jgi:histone H3/H4